MMKRSKLIIRDGHATLNGDKSTTEMPSGSLEIVAEDGRTLFRISISECGAMRVDAGTCCKHNDTILDDRIAITPIASNVVEIERPVYK